MAGFWDQIKNLPMQGTSTGAFTNVPGQPGGPPTDVPAHTPGVGLTEEGNPASAKFMRSGNPAATPPPATNPNTLMSGTMTLPGAPGAVAGIGPEGGIAENQAWKNAIATGNPGGTGQIPGVGGTLNVMSPNQFMPRFSTPTAAETAPPVVAPQGVTTPRTGNLYERLTSNLNSATRGAPPGTSPVPVQNNFENMPTYNTPAEQARVDQTGGGEIGRAHV